MGPTDELRNREENENKPIEEETVNEKEESPIEENTEEEEE